MRDHFFVFDGSGVCAKCGDLKDRHPHDSVEYSADVDQSKVIHSATIASDPAFYEGFYLKVEGPFYRVKV